MKPQHWSDRFSAAPNGDRVSTSSRFSEGEDESGVSTLSQKLKRRPLTPFWSLSKQASLVAILLGSAVLFPLFTHTVQSYTLPVRVDRWLEVRQVVGTATYYRDNDVQSAKSYETRLEQVGDRILTSNDSSVTLAVDTGIGFVDVAENTDLTIQELSIAPSGGRVTRLNIATGQARLRVRPFLNPDSELEIRTPAGVSGVRGTEFGVGVTPSGQTGVATLEGLVDTAAQGVTVSIEPGFQSLVVPGQPPTPPVPITNNVDLDITRLHVISGGKFVRVAGRIDPFSLLNVAGEIRNVNSEGWFNILVPHPPGNRIPVTVSTLTGITKDYELAIP